MAFCRIIGPPSEYALSQLFINGTEESIWQKIYKQNIHFYPTKQGLEYLTQNQSKVALIQHDFLVHSFEAHHCQVRTYLIMYNINNIVRLVSN